MRLFGVLLLVGLAVTAPTSNDGDDKLVTTQDVLTDNLTIYTADHDIVNLFQPVNAISSEISDLTLFFVEADIKENGEKDYKGLYILKNNQATKLLDDGRDFTAPKDFSKDAYFAASDGIYSYNAKDNTAVKYGTLTDSIINIAKELNTNNSDVLYILTESKELYKVTEGGTKKTKIVEVENAEQFVLDFSNNIFFYADDKIPFVLVDGEVKKIEDLPEKPSEVTLLRPPVMIEGGVPAYIDNKAYFLYANGTRRLLDITFAVQPTAYSVEAGLIQYYARNKKIYKLDMLDLILKSIKEKLR